MLYEGVPGRRWGGVCQWRRGSNGATQIVYGRVPQLCVCMARKGGVRLGLAKARRNKSLRQETKARRTEKAAARKMPRRVEALLVPPPSKPRTVLAQAPVAAVAIVAAVAKAKARTVAKAFKAKPEPKPRPI